MIPQQTLLLLLASGALVASTPRGVAPEDAALYTPDESRKFTCIANPSIKIPFSRVNDDFCDCPDGSDEPGSSACSHLPTGNVSIRGFYCRNTGHTPAFLPLSRVNDGICDYDICCDGSDEYAKVGGVACPSKCKEIGTAARKMAAERFARRSKGAKARDELVGKAVVLKRELVDNLATSKLKLDATEVKLKELRKKLAETEKRESLKAAQNPVIRRPVDLVVDVAKDRIAELKMLLAEVKDQRDAAESRLEKTEAVLSVLKEEYNPNFNDEGVKRAVRAWEEYLADEDNQERSKLDDTELKARIDGNDIDWDDYVPKEEEKPELYKYTQYLPPAAQKWIASKLQETRSLLVDNGLLARSKTDSESAAVSSARAAVTSAEGDVTKDQKHIDKLEKDITTDFGPSDVFRPLKGACVSGDFGEYNYEVCFFDRVTQLSRKDNGRTSLGTFERIELADDSSRNKAAGVFSAGWEESHVEPLSGMVLKHENGQQCWNGPKRSVAVELYCCAENEIRSVVEAEKCVYRFEVGTPAVCGAEGAEEKVRDEL